MITTDHQAALTLAQNDQLTGQALIKQAIAYLLKMPRDRIIFRPGLITEDQFLSGQYLQLSQMGRPVIQPLPIGEDPKIPVVLTREDIPAAFEALKKSLGDSHPTLHDHAIALSAQELVTHYETDPQQSIPDLLSKLSYTTSRTGYTGLPFSPANALCAQLAWLAVNKSNNNALEQFWKLLFPKAKSSTWPCYGEALLDENLARGEAGELINYRQVYAESQKAPSKPISRLKTFHSAHFNFWADENMNSSSTRYKNYYEFFIALKEFTIRHAKNRLGEEYEHKISIQGDNDFVNQFAFGLERFLTWHKSLDIIKQRTIEPILTPRGKSGLIEIIKNILSATGIQRCLTIASEKLKTLFEKNSDIQEYLSSLPFDLVLNEESLTGQDELDYLRSHCSFIEKLDFEGLLTEMKHGKNLPIDDIASRFIALPIKRSKAEDFFNFLAYLNEMDTELALIEAMKRLGHFPQFFLNDIDSYQHILRIHDRHSMIEDRISLLNEINETLSCNKLTIIEFHKKSFMISLIKAGQRDIETLKILVQIQKSLNQTLAVPHYINACRNNASEINAALDYFDKIEKETFDNLGDLFEFFEKLSEPKQKLAFGFYEEHFRRMIARTSDLEIAVGELPELAELLYEALKEKVKGMIDDTITLANLLKKLSISQRIDFCKILFDDLSSNKKTLFSSAVEMNAFINDHFTYTQNICLALAPFMISVVKTFDDYSAIKMNFRTDHLKDSAMIFENHLPRLIYNSAQLSLVLKDPHHDRNKILLALTLTGEIHPLIDRSELVYKLIQILDFSTLSQEQCEQIFKQLDLSSLQTASIDDYAKFKSISDPIKSSFVKEKILPYFNETLKIAAEIFYKMGNREVFNEDSIIELHRKNPLVHKCWRLASIKDDDQRIKESYHAVLEQREMKTRSPNKQKNLGDSGVKHNFNIK